MIRMNIVSDLFNFSSVRTTLLQKIILVTLYIVHTPIMNTAVLLFRYVCSRLKQILFDFTEIVS